MFSVIGLAWIMCLSLNQLLRGEGNGAFWLDPGTVIRRKGKCCWKAKASDVHQFPWQAATLNNPGLLSLLTLHVSNVCLNMLWLSALNQFVFFSPDLVSSGALRELPSILWGVIYPYDLGWEGRIIQVGNIHSTSFIRSMFPTCAWPSACLQYWTSLVKIWYKKIHIKTMQWGVGYSSVHADNMKE